MKRSSMWMFKLMVSVFLMHGIGMMPVLGQEPEGEVAETDTKTETKAEPATPAPEGAPEADYMTEEQLAEALVNVLGLASLLPPNPQLADKYGILLQNEILPRDGWNPENVVTVGNLARILVQAMGQQKNVENPEDDASWVDYLASMGIVIGTIEEALDAVPVINQPVAIRAVEVSTDPLRRIPFIRPADEQQLGADLQNFRRLISAAGIEELFQIITAPVTTPPSPPPVTPN